MNKSIPISVGYPSNQGLLLLESPNVKFRSMNGSAVHIYGENYTIGTPTLNMSTPLVEGGAMTASNTYNVYAYWDGSQIQIAPSAVGTTTGPVVGYVYRTGSPTYAYVGTLVVNSASAIASVFSYFNTPASYLLDRQNHTGGQDASTITSGVFDVARIPQVALSKLVTVPDAAARFALTTAQVQNGDTVLQVSPDNNMYYVVDDTNLNNASGYQLYTAFAEWSTLAGKPQNVVDIGAITGLVENDFIVYKSGAFIKQTLDQVKQLLGIKYQHQSSPLSSGTVTVAVGTNTLELTGALAATLTIDCTNLAQGVPLIVKSINGVTTLTLTGGTPSGFAPSILAGGQITIVRADTQLWVS